MFQKLELAVILVLKINMMFPDMFTITLHPELAKQCLNSWRLFEIYCNTFF